MVDDPEIEINVQKIKHLTDYGHKLLNKGETTEANEYFLNAYNIAKETRNEIVIRGCSFNLGACYVASGIPKLGLKYLELSISSTEIDDGVENYADLWYNIGIAQHSLNDIDNATFSYEKAYAAYIDLDEIRLAVECQSKLASCYYVQKRLNESVEMYKKATVTYSALSDQSHQALCLVNMTAVLSEMKDIEGCAKVLDTLLDVCQELDDKQLQGKIYHDVGLLYISENLFQSACDCFDQALKSVDNANSPDQLLKATIMQNIGAVCNFLQIYKKAMHFHKMAADMYGKLGERRAQAEVFINMAFAYTQNEKYSEALVSFQHAIQASKDCQDVDAQFRATEGMAAIYFRQEDFKLAISTYKSSLGLLGMTSDAESADRVVEKLADALNYKFTTPKPLSVRANTKGRPRFSQKRSLVAKGLHDRNLPSDGEDDALHEGHLHNSVRERSTRDSKTENISEQPLARRKKLSRAQNELFLAEHCQQRKHVQMQTSPKKSKVCAIM